jgi:F-type H+-transporting ATPase subunit b
MDLITPGLGLIFWTTLVFLILLVVLGKFAWKPINNAINKRNESIDKALSQAEKAREDIKNLKSEQDNIIKDAKNERDGILLEAKNMREEMVAKAKEETNLLVDKMKAEAKQDIENQKQQALGEIKDQMADLSISIAEHLLKEELKDKKKQTKLVEQLLDDVKLN